MNQRRPTGVLAAATSGRSALWPALDNLKFAPKNPGALLLGHAGNGMPQHYAAATAAKLLEATNAELKTRDRTMVLRVANG